MFPSSDFLSSTIIFSAIGPNFHHQYNNYHNNNNHRRLYNSCLLLLYNSCHRMSTSTSSSSSASSASESSTATMISSESNNLKYHHPIACDHFGHFFHNLFGYHHQCQSSSTHQQTISMNMIEKFDCGITFKK